MASFWDSLNYFGKKVTNGLLRAVEGGVDYIVGGVADLIGYDEYAEELMGNDWIDYGWADEEYRRAGGDTESGFWATAGSIGEGIGSSLPYLAIGIATSGLGNVASGFAAAGTAITTAGGTATSEAYKETGELGTKEWGYGTLSGTKEAALEIATGGLGKGIAAAGRSLGKTLAKESTESAVKSLGKATAKSIGRNSFIKSVAGDMISEGFEEGLSEYIDPYLKRVTYDPNAKDATLQEIGYAALVGSLSGATMSSATYGIGKGVSTVSDIKSGKKAVSSNTVDEIINTARSIAAFEEMNHTGFESSEDIVNTLKKLDASLEKTGGKVSTTEQEKLIGRLKRDTVETVSSQLMFSSVENILNNADAFVQQYNAAGIRGADGQVQQITREQLLQGIDFNDAKNTNRSIAKALKNNDTLRNIAAQDAAGRLMLEAAAYKNAVLSGQAQVSEAWLADFSERASDAEYADFAEKLGLDLTTATAKAVRIAAQRYMSDPVNAAVIEQVREAKKIDTAKAKALPKNVGFEKDGVKRYTLDGKDLAVMKKNGTYRVYEYDTGDVSRALNSKSELNKFLGEVRRAVSSANVNTAPINSTASTNLENAGVSKGESSASNTGKNKAAQTAADESSRTEQKTERAREAERVDKILRENVKDYTQISAPAQTMVRKTYRDAKASGMSDAEAITYAAVSARSGVSIQFSSKSNDLFIGYDSTGNEKYADGVYLPSENKIVVNPEGTRSAERTVIHELMHAIYSSYRGNKKNMSSKIFAMAKKNLPENERTMVENDYKDLIAQKQEHAKKSAEYTGELLALKSPGKADKIRARFKKGGEKIAKAISDDIITDETTAYYAEKALTNKRMLESLVAERPSLIDTILSFFKGAAESYSDNADLSRAARRFEKQYRKMFDEFASRNKGRNATESISRVNPVKGEKRHSFSSIANSFFGDPNMSAKDFEDGKYKNTEGYKKYVEDCLSNMSQTMPNYDEASARKEVVKSIDGIVKVAVAMKKAGYDIYDDPQTRSKTDSRGRALFSSLEPNSDYFTSHDISTICDKRKNFAEIYDDIVREETRRNVPHDKRFFNNVDNYFYIHKVLADKGLTQPCKECYVESMRKNLAPMAQAFMTLVGEENVNNKKNKQLYNTKGELKSNNAATREWVREQLAEYGLTPSYFNEDVLTTEDGLAAMKISYPNLYEAFNSFYGQSKPKMPKGAVPFRFGDLTALLTDNKGRIKEGLVRKINATGGFRLQSYSDFQIKNYVDVLQVIFEAGTLGLTGHAYTKVPAFLAATEKTNLKRNLSVFTYRDGNEWKIDKNDSFPGTLESIYEIVNADKSGNTSIIVVSQNADNSAWIMANPDVGYGIPFHKSGLKMDTVRNTIVKEGGREILGYKDAKDHTKEQSEVYASDKKKVKQGISIYEENLWDFENKSGLSKKKLIEKNIKAYIDKCQELGYLPKFREYIDPNKGMAQKVLAEAKKNGWIAEDASVSDVAFRYGGYLIPYGYYKFLGDFGMFTPDGKASPPKRLSLKNYDFAKAVEYFSNSEKLRREEILQQFANGEERTKYRESGMTAEELEAVVKSKRKEVVDEIVGNIIPLSERFNPENDDIRYALPLDAESPTIDNVGKTSFKKQNFGSVKDRLYIEAVDETYGIEKYLRKIGKREDAIPFVQQVRAAETMAQSMLGTDQYDITEGATQSGKRLGDGLAKIFEPITKRAEVDQKYAQMFDDYLLHYLNIDRMTLDERTFAEQKARLERLEELNKRIIEINKELKDLKGNRDKDITSRRIKLKTELKKINPEQKKLTKEVKAYVPVTDKPVFDKSNAREKAITAEESRKIIAEYDKKFPQFKEIAEKVWKYSDNLLEMRVEAGLVSAENAALMRKYYPHYVPSFRDKDNSGKAVPVKGAGNLEVSSTIKRAKGGGEDIYSIQENLAKQTVQAVKAIQINRLANAVYDAAVKQGDSQYVEVTERKKVDGEQREDRDTDVQILTKTNQVTFYKDGEKITMSVSKDLFLGFKGLTSPSTPDFVLARAANAAMRLFKNLVTQFSPAFAVRNAIRDLQDAYINSKHPAGFFKNSIKGAFLDIINNSEQWQLYRAYGGFASTVFDAKGFTSDVGHRGFEALKSLGIETDSNLKKILGGGKNALKDVLIGIGNVNAFIEQLTRYTEFKASLAAGDSVQTAINNSAEVTTNFSRRGSLTKVLNSVAIPFLNASIQGTDKAIRVIKDAFGEKNAKMVARALTVLFLKIAAIGIAPMLINNLINAGDEDYENLEEEVRENYFLIKIGDEFLKIPRGRVASVWGGLSNRISLAAQGKDADISGYLENVWTQMSPVESASRTILAPLNDIATNTTWYGGDIEGREFDGVRPKDRYDESTSSIAIAIGQVTGWSPKKIHYLLDQYSGVIGDFVLPATTKKAEKNYLEANFLIDPVTNNKLSADFYKLYDEAQYKKNEGDTTAIYQLKHLNDVKAKVSDLYDDISKVQNSDKTSAEKLQQTRTIRVLINNIYKTAKTDYAAYTRAIESTQGLFDESTDAGVRMRHTEITRRMYGAEKAFEEWNGQTYEKMKLLNASGVDYDKLYLYYFGTKDIKNDVDKKGNVIEGSKKKKIAKAINALDISKQQKALLLATSGYSVGDYKPNLLKYILSLNISQSEKLELAKAAGFTVKNGKIDKASVYGTSGKSDSKKNNYSLFSLKKTSLFGS